MSSDGSILAVGAWLNEEDKGDTENDNGSLRVFALDGGNWAQRGRTISGEMAKDKLGRVVSISADGNIIAVSTNEKIGDESNISRGSVKSFVYDDTSNDWTQLGSDIINSGATDSAPTSLAMSSDGNILAIGGKDNIMESAGNGDNSGSVHVFKFNNGNWTQQGTVIYGENMDKLGVALAMSSDGSILAVGAHHNDGTGTDAGHVRVIQWDSCATAAPSAVSYL